MWRVQLAVETAGVWRTLEKAEWGSSLYLVPEMGRNIWYLKLGFVLNLDASPWQGQAVYVVIVFLCVVLYIVLCWMILLGI